MGPNVEDFEDVWMRQGGHGSGLTLKALEPVRIRRDGGGQHLDRDLSFELGIPGSIDLAHPARPERAEHLVTPQTVSPGQGHIHRTASSVSI